MNKKLVYHKKITTKKQSSIQNGWEGACTSPIKKQVRAVEVEEKNSVRKLGHAHRFVFLVCGRSIVFT